MKYIFNFLLIFWMMNTSLYANNEYFLQIYEGNAHYKAQIGGGYYELAEAHYTSDEALANIYTITLNFGKKINKFINSFQEEILHIEIITPRHVKITTDKEERIVVFPNRYAKVELNTQKGKIALLMELIQTN
jgi:hypothetical protein